VVIDSPGDKVNKSPNEKRQGWQAPGKQSKSTPFDDFTKKIGRGNVFKQSSMRNLITTLTTLLPEIDQQIIVVLIDKPSRGKKYYSDDKPWIVKPIGRITGRQRAKPVSVYKSVYQIKKEGRANNEQWHFFLFSPQSQGKDQGSVYIVDHPQAKGQHNYIVFEASPTYH
jgi:hypothetical protein